MNRQQITSKLRKVFGKNACWKINDKAKDADERAALNASLPAVKAERDEAKRRMDAKRAELLSDPEYLAMRAAYQRADEAVNAALYYSNRCRISAGTSSSVAGIGFFTVQVQGDTWDEVFAKLANKNS